MNILSPPARLQRVEAEARIAVENRDGRTRLARLYQHGAAKMRLPRLPADPLEVILLNTAGGLTDGDSLSWSVDAGTDADVVATTQACEKIYRSAGGAAEVAVSLHAGPGAHLVWLPQETIVYQGGHLSRRIEVDMSSTASLVLLEATIFGRTAMGENVTTARLRDRWRVRVGDRLVHAEDFAAGPDIAGLLATDACMAGGRAVATLLAIGAGSVEMLDAARTIVGDDGGVSAWTVSGTGKLLARIVAGDGYALRRRLVPLAALLMKEAELPRVWSL